MVARIADGRLVLDVRTVSDVELQPLAHGLARAFAEIQEESVDHAGSNADNWVGDGENDDDS